MLLLLEPMNFLLQVQQARIYPRPEYTRVYYGLGQLILRGIFWPMPIHTPSGHNILRRINWPRPEYTRNIPGYNLSWAVLAPGKIRAASNLSRKMQTDYATTFRKL